MNYKLLRHCARYLILLTVLAAVALAQKPVVQLKPSADRLRETVLTLVRGSDGELQALRDPRADGRRRRAR